MRPHILLLTTGGTIASLPTAEGLAPGLDGEALAGLLPQGIMDCYDITIRDILHLDSSNIQPEEWQTIARHVFENRMEYSGIVITHGTDTMAYTASVLSFMLRGISIPVVLTGAQLPMAHPLSDGMENLRTALAMAASGVPGVFLAFDRKVILGCRAVKTRTTDFDAFESVNWPLAANVDGKGLQIHREAIPAPAGACALRDKLCDKVFLIKLTPGLDPEIFDMLLQMHYRGIVIEAFGAGGLRPAGSDRQAPGGRPGGHDRGGVLPVPLRAQRLLRLRGGAEGSGPGGDPGPGYDHRGGGDQAHVGPGPDRGPGAGPRYLRLRPGRRGHPLKKFFHQLLRMSRPPYFVGRDMRLFSYFFILGASYL